jgi:hypothetical protein
MTTSHLLDRTCHPRHSTSQHHNCWTANHNITSAGQQKTTGQRTTTRLLDRTCHPRHITSAAQQITSAGQDVPPAAQQITTSHLRGRYRNVARAPWQPIEAEQSVPSDLTSEVFTLHLLLPAGVHWEGEHRPNFGSSERERQVLIAIRLTATRSTAT